MPVSQNVTAAMRAAGGDFVKLEELQQAISNALSPLFGSERVRIVSGSHAALLLVSAVFLCGNDQYALSLLPESAKNLEICLLPEEAEVPSFPIELVGCQIQRKHPDREDLHIVSEQYFLPTSKQKKLAILCRNPVSCECMRLLCQYADAVIFDGSIFHAPRQTAVIASTEMIDAGLKLITAPQHGIGRSFKTGKEEIAGAYAAVLEYFGGELK